MGPISVAKVYLFFVIPNHSDLREWLMAHDARRREEKER